MEWTRWNLVQAVRDAFANAVVGWGSPGSEIGFHSLLVCGMLAPGWLDSGGRYADGAGWKAKRRDFSEYSAFGGDRRWTSRRSVGCGFPVIARGLAGLAVLAVRVATVM